MRLYTAASQQNDYDIETLSVQSVVNLYNICVHWTMLNNAGSSHKIQRYAYIADQRVGVNIRKAAIYRNNAKRLIKAPCVQGQYSQEQWGVIILLRLDIYTLNDASLYIPYLNAASKINLYFAFEAKRRDAASATYWPIDSRTYLDH